MKKLQLFKEKIEQMNKFSQEIESVKMAIGNVEASSSQKGNGYPREYKVFSQWGEDGIIQWLINNIHINCKKFIEFGVQNYTESNTRFLLKHDNWSGLIIDGDEKNIEYVKRDDIYWRYDLKAVRQFITVDNINDIFKSNGFDGEIGLLSVDIDGNDYWVWKAINCINPQIVICEYNHRFGKEAAVTVPYRADFVREKAHYSCIYYGASILAFVNLADEKGYSLVAGNSNGNNIFFVRNDCLNSIVQKRSIDECFTHGKFRESRNEDGSLAFLSLKEEQELLSKLKFVDVSKQ